MVYRMLQRVLGALAMVLVLAGCGAAGPTDVAERDTAAPGGMLIQLHQTGGFAGIDETLTVLAGGQVVVRDGRGDQRRLQLTAAQLATLQALLASPALSAAEARYQSPGADLFVYELTVTLPTGTRTITTMDAAAHPAEIGELLGMLAEWRRQAR